LGIKTENRIGKKGLGQGNLQIKTSTNSSMLNSTIQFVTVF
jgi:hypothetical protein